MPACVLCARKGWLLLLLLGCGGAPGAPPKASAGGPRAAKVGEAIVFDGAASSDPSGSVVSHHWEFGDSTEADGARVTHAYTVPGTYVAILTVRNEQGRSGRDTAEVTVTGAAALPPEAKIAGPSSGLKGDSLTFDGSGSKGPAAISSYAWSFGDGGTATGEKASHIFTADGQYPVRLTVTDTAGQSGVASLTVTIGIVAGNRNPVASPGRDVLARVGDRVKLDGSASYDPDASDSITAYDWDFGDGTAHESGVRVEHAWSTPGTYTVALVVTDSKGATGKATAKATIAPPPDYSGKWIFNPTPASFGCAKYQLGFPAPVLDIVASGGTLSAQDPAASQRKLSGTVKDGKFSLAAKFSEAGPCGPRAVTETLTAEFSSERALNGNYNVFHSYSDVTCNCSAIFQVTAGKQ